MCESIEREIQDRDDWARRRQKSIPTDRRLMVVACMDDRIPVEQVLGLELGDAHVFRNAGGKVTGAREHPGSGVVNVFGRTAAPPAHRAGGTGAEGRGRPRRAVVKAVSRHSERPCGRT